MPDNNSGATTTLATVCRPSLIQAFNGFAKGRRHRPGVQVVGDCRLPEWNGTAPTLRLRLADDPASERTAIALSHDESCLRKIDIIPRQRRCFADAHARQKQDKPQILVIVSTDGLLELETLFRSECPVGGISITLRRLVHILHDVSSDQTGALGVAKRVIQDGVVQKLIVDDEKPHSFRCV
jgi:hypothetical protein